MPDIMGRRKYFLLSSTVVVGYLLWHAEGFHCFSSTRLRSYSEFSNRLLHSSKFSTSGENTDRSEPQHEAWNSSARKVITGLSAVGAVETGYLSFTKLFVPGGIDNICGDSMSPDASSSCGNVLNSPYANIDLGGTEIPLTLVGFVAYVAVSLLSAIPLLARDNDTGRSDSNRIAILAITTAMATFSSFLLSLLFNVLHQSCPYCLLSAGISLSMGLVAWTSGALPANRKRDGVKVGLGSFVTATVASFALFLSVDEAAISAYSNNVMQGNGLMSGQIVALADDSKKTNIPPPPITSTSSERALRIGQDLKSLNAKMFGAYWCSHCYEQKQRLGKEAYRNVQYVECSKEGLDSKSSLCKERNIPGYPTWEINGNLYPGDMYLDELEDIIQKELQKVQI
jgi:Predicted membrane protein